jgi:FlaA1/EpsC-like NDP-sugar epimerase
VSIIFILEIYFIVFFLFGIYKNIRNTLGLDELLLTLGACIAAGVLSLTFTDAIRLELPESVQVMAGTLSTGFICGYRIIFRGFHEISRILSGHEARMHRVMLVGGGSAASQLIKEIRSQKDMNYEVVAIIDDDEAKYGTSLCGITVMGNRNCIEVVAEKKAVDIIMLAIPTLDNKDKHEILDICKKTRCRIKTVPGLYDLMGQEEILQNVRDVDVEDLLGRDTVKLDMDGIKEYLEDQTVLVTGGGGSIGSELCRQIMRFSPKELIILDIYENNAYDIQNELSYKYPDISLKVFIASVRDRKRIDHLVCALKPDVIFHAAAHKHVPLMEFCPSEAIKNNVFGTLNLAEAAERYGVRRFVMISTDKAVNPTNIMGATKRMCEMIIQGMDKVSTTEFVAVRFGNVLGSNGSVIPLFKKQISHGGPVTLTHKEITRFFMTIQEAAQLVIQAGAYAEGGEVFVLDMGKPVRIYDLACDLIKLSGFEPNKDIMIEITGLRPGEKLYEELMMDEEGLHQTRHEKIFVGNPMGTDIMTFKEKLHELRFLLDNEDKEEIGKKIAEIVPTYKRPEVQSAPTQAAVPRVIYKQ